MLSDLPPNPCPGPVERVAGLRRTILQEALDAPQEHEQNN